MRAVVVYASKHGSTAEVAERIALALIRDGIDADALAVADVGDVTRYDALVIGSSVYFGRWMREAVAFVERNRARLSGRLVWLFSVGPLGDQPLIEPADLADVAASLNVAGHRIFSGALDMHRLSLPERFMVKGVKAPSGDFRDWKEIDAWASSIAHQLVVPPTKAEGRAATAKEA